MDAVFTIVQPGETIDSLSEALFQGNPNVYRSKEEAKSIIVENNPTVGGGIWPGIGLNITPRVPGFQNINAWAADEKTVHHEFLKMSEDTRQLLSQNPDAAQAMLKGAEDAKGNKWKLGWNDIMTLTGYTVTGTDAYYGAQGECLGAVAKYASQLVKEAVDQLGKGTVFKKNPANLQKLENFLRSSPTFKGLQTATENLPKQLAKKIGNISPRTTINCSNARWARKEIFIPAMNRGSRYFSRMNTLVGKNLVRLGRIGTTTTWVLPIGLGVYNTMNAAPAQRGLVGTKEAVGIVWGAAGTTYTLYALGTLMFTSAGTFILVALVAGFAGWGLAEVGKWVGEKAYKFGENISYTYF